MASPSMTLLPLLSIALGFVALAHAVPVFEHLEARDGVANIDIKDNPSHIPNGPAALAAAYSKWGIRMEKPLSQLSTSHLAAAAPCCQTNAQPLDNDWLYITSLQVGRPDQDVFMVLDTGSSDLWMQYSDSEYDGKSPTGRRAPDYDPHNSETSIEVKGSQWAVQYGDGSASSGKVYLDQVRIGSNLLVTNMSLECAVKVAPTFANDPMLSGVIGFAKSRPSRITPSMPTLLERIKPLLAEPYMTIDLRANVTGGAFGFGQIDPKRYVGEITWGDSDPASEWWNIKITHFRMSGMDANVWWVYDFAATIDTGTTLILLPGPIVGAYWAAVPESRYDPAFNAWVFPCSLANGIPDFQFLVDSGYQGTVPAKYLNYGPVEGDLETCWGAIQSSSGFPNPIFGSVLIKSQFVTFNLVTNQIGFAKKNLP